MARSNGSLEECVCARATRARTCSIGAILVLEVSSELATASLFQSSSLMSLTDASSKHSSSVEPPNGNCTCSSMISPPSRLRAPVSLSQPSSSSSSSAVPPRDSINGARRCCCWLTRVLLIHELVSCGRSVPLVVALEPAAAAAALALVAVVVLDCVALDHWAPPADAPVAAECFGPRPTHRSEHE